MISRRKIIERHEQNCVAQMPKSTPTKSTSSNKNEIQSKKKKEVPSPTSLKDNTDLDTSIEFSTKPIRSRLRAEMLQASRVAPELRGCSSSELHLPSSSNNHRGAKKAVERDRQNKMFRPPDEDEEEDDVNDDDEDDIVQVEDEEDEPKLSAFNDYRKWFDPYSVYGDDDDDDEDVWYSDERLFEVSSLSASQLVELLWPVFESSSSLCVCKADKKV